MLPKKNRLDLRSKPEFFEQAERYYSPLFTIHYQLRKKKSQSEAEKEKQANKNPTQATVIIKKKDFKTAVARHQLARKGRSALLQFLKKKRPVDLVLVFKRQASGADFKKIKQEIVKFDQWLQSHS